MRLAILGPTCSGKSAVAIEVAARLHAEIISCDSMLVYRGMDIGTAKPRAADRLRVPHHLIDILDVGDPHNVNSFLTLCEALLSAPENRTKSFVLVGGSGLYARALLYGYRLPPADPAVKAQIQAESEAAGGLVKLAAELTAANPGMAARVGLNPRRLARAIEILRLGGPRSDAQTVSTEGTTAVGASAAPWQQVIILPPWKRHQAAIGDRTREMIKAGWIAEAEALLAKGLATSPTARQALGYPDIAAFLRGEIGSREELTAQIVRRTVRYARRQRTWFRHQHPGAHVLEAFWGGQPDEGAAAILDWLGGVASP